MDEALRAFRRPPWLRLFLSILCLLLLSSVRGIDHLDAQQPEPPSSPARLDFTLFDAPYNVGFGGRAPSMRQSLDITIGQYELAHDAIQSIFGERRRLGLLATTLYDVFGAALPF